MMNIGISFVYCGALSLFWRERSVNRRERVQALYLFLAVFMAAAVGELNMLISHLFPKVIERLQVTDLAESPAIVMVVFGIIIWRIIVRYEFMHTAVFIRLNELIENSAVPIIFADNNLDMMKISKTAAGFFKEELLSGGSVCRLFIEEDYVKNEAEKTIITGEISDGVYATPAGAADEKFLLRFLPARDRSGDGIGVIFVVSRVPGFSEVADEYALTSRELDILMLVIKGFSNKEIADTLDLSPGTVKIHVHNIYGKTGTKNRVELSQILK